MSLINAFLLFHVVYLAQYGGVAGKGGDLFVGIVGGNNISIYETPYMASVRIGNKHYCGSSIIHERFILTAAHCIETGLPYTIVVGSDTLDERGVKYEVEKIIVHPNYTDKTYDYDTAIIKLTKPIKYGPRVRAILLADDDLNLNKGKIAIVSGWGYLKENGQVSNKLQQVSVPLVDTEECQETYLPEGYRITSRMICAGSKGKDSCQGDSGGPLLLDEKQIGIVSFGIGCGTRPGVYTKVSALLPWIKETIKNNRSLK